LEVFGVETGVGVDVSKLFRVEAGVLTIYEPMYMVTPNCLWSVGRQIVSILTFLTGAFAKLKRGHVKRYAVALCV